MTVLFSYQCFGNAILIIKINLSKEKTRINDSSELSNNETYLN